MGISGQDGRILSNLFTENSWQVFGIYNKSIPVNVHKNIISIKCESTSYASISKILDGISPHIIINVAGIPGNAQDLKLFAEKYPNELSEVTYELPINILNWVQANPNTGFITALSSLMYSPTNKPDLISSKSQLNPQGMYAELKSKVFQTLEEIRLNSNLKIVGAILFPHTSYLEKKLFVIQKLAWNLKLLKSKKISKYQLLLPDQPIDIGNAFDYCECLFKVTLNLDNIESDFVIASGSTTTLRDLFNHLNTELNLKMENSIEYSFENTINPYLVGDITYAKEKIGWTPRNNILTTFVEIFNRYEIA